MEFRESQEMKQSPSPPPSPQLSYAALHDFKLTSENESLNKADNSTTFRAKTLTELPGEEEEVEEDDKGEVFSELHEVEVKTEVDEDGKARKWRQRPARCDVCGRGFTQRSNMIRHRYLHTVGKQHHCSDCDKEFPTAYALKRHLLTHSATKTDEQSQESLAEEAKKTDTRKHRQKPAECDVCGKTFTQRNNMIRHRALHSKKKSHLCAECGKQFSHLHYLKNHILTHSKTKRHKCSSCLSCFTTKSELNRHLRIHTSAREYKCHLCPMTFQRKDVLNEHMESHCEEGTHECDECGKKFVLEKYLTKHMVVHTGIKLYTCDTCGNEFHHKSDLNRHEVIHIEVRRFECEMCGRRFTFKCNLRKHILIHQKLKDESCLQRGKTSNQQPQDT